MKRTMLALALTLPLALLSGSDQEETRQETPASSEDTFRPATILYTIHNVGYIEPCG